MSTASPKQSSSKDPQRRERSDAPMLSSRNTFKIGVFGHNNRGGMWVTTSEDSPRATWEETKALTLAAEAAGLEAVIPNARWKGFGGETNFNSWALEAFTWAAGLAAVTSEIQLFATVHVPTLHPIRVAKEAATIDHISDGRFGLNVVAGWNANELAMFGIEIRDHDDRYDYSDEWMQLIDELWAADEEFDFAGEFFTSTGAYSEPKPVQSPRPTVMNAAISDRGQQFAARHADINFMVLESPEEMADYVKKIKGMASEHDRDISVMTNATIVCADSENEAKRLFDHYIRDLGDWEAARNFTGQKSKQAPDFRFDSMERRVMVGHFATPLVGTPEQITETIGTWVEAGVEGMAVSWLDFDEGIAQYAEEIRPLLVEAGLRTR